MNIFDEAFGTDLDAEKNGVVVDYGPFSVTLKHAYRTNSSYAKMLEKEMEPVRRAFENNLLDRDRQNDILYKVFSKTIVVDWDGVKDDDGVEIPFSSQSCYEYFVKYPKFFDAIKDDSENNALFKKIAEASKEEDVKNF